MSSGVKYSETPTWATVIDGTIPMKVVVPMDGKSDFELLVESMVTVYESEYGKNHLDAQIDLGMFVDHWWADMSIYNGGGGSIKFSDSLMRLLRQIGHEVAEQYLKMRSNVYSYLFFGITGTESFYKTLLNYSLTFISSQVSEHEKKVENTVMRMIMEVITNTASSDITDHEEKNNERGIFRLSLGAFDIKMPNQHNNNLRIVFNPNKIRFFAPVLGEKLELQSTVYLALDYVMDIIEGMLDTVVDMGSKTLPYGDDVINLSVEYEDLPNFIYSLIQTKISDSVSATVSPDLPRLEEAVQSYLVAQAKRVYWKRSDLLDGVIKWTPTAESHARGRLVGHSVVRPQEDDE